VRIDVPFYKQLDKGCGAASLGMLVAYWSQRTPQLEPESPESLYQRLYAEDEGGIRLADMKAYLADRGYHAFTLRGEFAQLERHVEKGRPVIVSTRSGRRLHYTVVTGIDGDRLWVHDPARGKPRTIKQRRFVKQWTKGEGWMLLAVPTGEAVQ